MQASSSTICRTLSKTSSTTKSSSCQYSHLIRHNSIATINIRIIWCSTNWVILLHFVSMRAQFKIRSCHQRIYKTKNRSSLHTECSLSAQPTATIRARRHFRTMAKTLLAQFKPSRNRCHDVPQQTASRRSSWVRNWEWSNIALSHTTWQLPKPWSRWLLRPVIRPNRLLSRQRQPWISRSLAVRNLPI